jgi:hypothetical protein
MVGCNKNLTALQRRSLRQVGGVLLLTVVTNLTPSHAPNPLLDLFPGLDHWLAQQHASVGLAGLFSAVALLPIVLAVSIAASYLRAEPDEFMRMLLVRALLWGFVITMAGDAVLSVLTMLYARPFPISLLNADVFFISTGLAFRALQWSYR